MDYRLIKHLREIADEMDGGALSADGTNIAELLRAAASEIELTYAETKTHIAVFEEIRKKALTPVSVHVARQPPADC